VVLQHDWHRQHRQQHHRGTDDAGGCRQQNADDDHRQAEAAPDTTEDLDEIAHHDLGDARAVEHLAHVDEHRQRHQNPVGHDGVEAVDDTGHLRPIRQQEGVHAELVAKENGNGGEKHRQTAQQPGHRVAAEQ
jgi:hypothetical protein